MLVECNALPHGQSNVDFFCCSRSSHEFQRALFQMTKATDTGSSDKNTAGYKEERKAGWGKQWTVTFPVIESLARGDQLSRENWCTQSTRNTLLKRHNINKGAHRDEIYFWRLSTSVACLLLVYFLPISSFKQNSGDVSCSGLSNLTTLNHQRWGKAAAAAADGNDQLRRRSSLLTCTTCFMFTNIAWWAHCLISAMACFPYPIENWKCYNTFSFHHHWSIIQNSLNLSE